MEVSVDTDDVAIEEGKEYSEEGREYTEEGKEYTENEGGEKSEFPEIFIDLDEVESDCEEIDSTSNTAEFVRNDDITEFMDSLGLKGPPDSSEMEILKLPSIEVVTSETKEMRDNRTVVVYPICLADLSHPVFQKLFIRDCAVSFSVNCDRSDDGLNSWVGSATFGFKSTHAAVAARDELLQLRTDIKVHQGLDAADAKLKKDLPGKTADSWTDRVLLVKNIGDPVDTSKLKELFPDADVVVHKDALIDKLRGQVYLLYETKEKADSVLKECINKKVELNDHRLVVVKWRKHQGKIIPDGMLRIAERKMVFEYLNTTKLQIEKSGEAEWLNNKIEWCQDILDKDDQVRMGLGLTTPSYEHLLQLKNLRKYTEAEAVQTTQKLLAPYKKKRQEEYKKKRQEKEEAEKKTSSPDKTNGARSNNRDKERDKERDRERGKDAKSKGRFARARENSRFGSAPSSKFNSASRKRPIPLLSDPKIPVKRLSGHGLLGARPQSPQRETNRGQPPSLLTLQGLHPIGAGGPSAPMYDAPGRFGNTYPGVTPLVRDIRDLNSMDGYRKAPRMSDMDRYNEDEMRRASFGGNRYEQDVIRPLEYEAEHRYKMQGQRKEIERRPEPGYRKEVDEGYGMEKHHVGRPGTYERPRNEDTRRPEFPASYHSNEDARRNWESIPRLDVKDTREERPNPHRESGSRIDLASAAAKTDPVSLLLNLSQLLAEKMQRDRERP